MQKILLFLFVLFDACFGGAGAKVTIEVHAPSTDESAQIYIAGNNEQMGGWRPDRVQLDFAGDHLWRKTFYFKKGEIVEYKITRGSWDNEAADAHGRPFQNSVLQVKGDTTLVDTVLHWKEGRAPIEGGVVGEVRTHRGLEGDGLLPRDVIVWLPPGYDDNSKRRYPVLYMHDGQNIFDPHTAAFGVDWRIDETADSLIRAGEIEPLIIVGIYNTPQRSREYTPCPLGDRYRDFVIRVVKPLIDRTYRCKKGPAYSAVGGSSAGGLVAFMLAWEHPELFSKAICMSPAFKIEDIDYVRQVRAYNGDKKNLRLYIDNGGVGLEQRLQPGVDAMLAALKEKGFQGGVDYFWVKDRQARHFEAAWGKRMPEALKIFWGHRGE